jgi:uncharacterized protein
MFLKLLLFAVAGVMVYRAFGGKVPLLDGDKPSDKSNSDDTLVECATCGTYVTTQESITVHQKHYCSKECIPD